MILGCHLFHFFQPRSTEKPPKLYGRTGSVNCNKRQDFPTAVSPMIMYLAEVSLANPKSKHAKKFQGEIFEGQVTIHHRLLNNGSCFHSSSPKKSTNAELRGPFHQKKHKHQLICLNFQPRTLPKN